ncbi:WD40 repeat-like protein [Schizophyllum commune Loenen D]|nr:WD40 repeat-like protein [Schizophyllum commune Loenen D]
MQEIVLCATAASSSSASSSTGPGCIALHDLQTGNSLASFKQTNAPRNSTAILESTGSEGGFMLSCQPDKSILNVYNFQKDQLAMKIVLPEKLTCIALDPRGHYCAGGTAQGRIYLWEVSSGILYNAWDGHYRQVTVLRFTRDGAALISGSDDSGVSVWSVSRLVDDDLQNELPLPYTTLSDHTLPITDITCGVGVFPQLRVLTASVDHSVKVWDLATKSLLTTFTFPQVISCLAWDVAERFFFAAAPDGSVHQVNLFRDADEKSGIPAEAVGGAGLSDVIRIEDIPAEARRKRLISVSEPVSALCISATGALLLVGTTSGPVHVYDIPSHQLLRTITTHKGFTVTHLATMLKPPDLVGHVSLSMSAGDPKDVVPVRPVAAFQRMRDAKARTAHEIATLLPPSARAADIAYSEDEMLRDHAFFLQPAQTSGGQQDAVTLQARVTDLEGEVAALREQLGKAKGVNDMMWDNIVQKVVRNRQTGAPDDGEADEERKRKRGRT